MSVFIHPSLVEQRRETVNIDATIITSLIFVDVLAWIEFLLYDFRHFLNEQDLVEQKQNINPLNIIKKNSKSSRQNYFLFAVSVSILTIIVIIILKRFPIKIDI
jgi:hypothetical protein